MGPNQPKREALVVLIFLPAAGEYRTIRAFCFCSYGHGHDHNKEREAQER